MSDGETITAAVKSPEVDETSKQANLQSDEETSERKKSLEKLKLASGDAENSDGGSSEERCPICLAAPENKAKTDTCFHTFCFGCIQEWSKVKAECPLCKARFQYILYNVRSEYDYDQFEVQPQQQDLSSNPFLHINIPHGLPGYSFATGYDMDRGWMVEQSMERWSNGLMEWRERMHAQRENARAASLACTDVEVIRRRRLYYRNGTKVSCVNNNGQVRDISPGFYLRNPAQVHRLVPWIKRELIVLFGAGNMPVINRVRDMVVSAVTTMGISSSEFRDNIKTIFRDRLDHFIHEFLSFAKSPHDISSYDRNAKYLGLDRINTARGSKRAKKSLRHQPTRERSRWSDVSTDEDAGDASMTSSRKRYCRFRDYQNSPFMLCQQFPSTPLEPPLRHVNNWNVLFGTSSREKKSTRSSRYFEKRRLSPSRIRRHQPKPDDVIILSSSDDEQRRHQPSTSKDAKLSHVDGTAARCRVAKAEVEDTNDDDEVEFVRFIKPPHLRTPDAVVDLSSSCDDEPGPSSKTTPAKTAKLAPPPAHSSRSWSSSSSSTSDSEPVLKKVKSKVVSVDTDATDPSLTSASSCDAKSSASKASPTNAAFVVHAWSDADKPTTSKLKKVSVKSTPGGSGGFPGNNQLSQAFRKRVMKSPLLYTSSSDEDEDRRHPPERIFRKRAKKSSTSDWSTDG